MSEIVELDDLEFEPYISNAEILNSVRKIADKINADYAGKEVVLICVLKGSFVFVNDLIRHINLPMQVDFIRVSSYNGLRSSGALNISLDYNDSIKDKHVIIIEDIVDTGLTAKRLLDRAANLQPASLGMASLFVKPGCIKTKINIDYIGIEIPDDFVVGYGMDYNELGRELSSVYKRKK